MHIQEQHMSGQVEAAKRDLDLSDEQIDRLYNAVRDEFELNFGSLDSYTDEIGDEIANASLAYFRYVMVNKYGERSAYDRAMTNDKLGGGFILGMGSANGQWVDLATEAMATL